MYVETNEPERRADNEKRAEAAEKQGLKPPSRFEVIDPSLKVADYKGLYLESEKQMAHTRKVKQMQHAAIHTKKRNDLLTLHLGGAILSSIDPVASRGFTNPEYFPAVRNRTEFLLDFISNPMLTKLQQEVIFTMTK